MYLTGWRKSEVLSLDWRQVGFKAGTVTLDVGSTKSKAQGEADCALRGRLPQELKGVLMLLFGEQQPLEVPPQELPIVQQFPAFVDAARLYRVIDHHNGGGARCVSDSVLDEQLITMTSDDYDVLSPRCPLPIPILDAEPNQLFNIAPVSRDIVPVLADELVAGSNIALSQRGKPLQNLFRTTHLPRVNPVERARRLRHRPSFLPWGQFRDNRPQARRASTWSDRQSVRIS
jgi:hypothetical protein